MSYNHVYLDISIGGSETGRIVIELQDKLAPKSTENFKQLCISKAYNKTIFHRIIKNFMIQAGDITYGCSSKKYPPEKIGTGGHSTYTTDADPIGKFEDENLDHTITSAFLVCMANSGPNSNTSQFFISTYPSPHLTGKHTVFGKVVHGKAIVREVERVDVMSNKNSEDNAWIPVERQKVVINDCGLWKDGDTLPNYVACVDTIGGDIYEEYPDDNEIEGLDLEKGDVTIKICTTIKESATMIFKQKRFQDAFFKYRKALRYCNELIPDEESDKTNFKKFLDLKKTLFLNLSLTALQSKNYQTCIDYCGYLLEMEDAKLTDLQMSKVFFRLGKSYAFLKKYDNALEFFRTSHQFNPADKTIETETKLVEKLVAESKQTEKQKYAKFFS